LFILNTITILFLNYSIMKVEESIPPILKSYGKKTRKQKAMVYKTIVYPNMKLNPVIQICHTTAPNTGLEKSENILIDKLIEARTTERLLGEKNDAALLAMLEEDQILEKEKLDRIDRVSEDATSKLRSSISEVGADETGLARDAAFYDRMVLDVIRELKAEWK
jgi:hypothetical protein